MKRQKREFEPGDRYNLPGFLWIEVIDSETYNEHELYWKLMKTPLRHRQQKIDISNINCL